MDTSDLRLSMAVRVILGQRKWWFVCDFSHSTQFIISWPDNIICSCSRLGGGSRSVHSPVFERLIYFLLRTQYVGRWYKDGTSRKL